MFAHNVLIAFALSLLAGLATGIGGALAFITDRTNKKMLSLGLGFSAGVMIYLSFVEIFPDAQDLLVRQYGDKKGQFITILAFFGGVALSALIDRMIPSCENPHEMHLVEELSCRKQRRRHRKECSRLLKTGLFVTLAIVAHNFPEGIATFVASLRDPQLGLSLALAIMLHNIPEGIAVAIPVYYATNDTAKAFRYSLFSGLAEPAGALLAYLLLMPFMTDAIFGIMFAGIAGIMIYISLDELLPSAEACGQHHLSIAGMLGGMFLIALNLLMF